MTFKILQSGKICRKISELDMRWCLLDLVKVLKERKTCNDSDS
jgi:hypothetical protein